MHIAAEENSAGVSVPRTTVHPVVRHVRNVTVAVFALVTATAIAVLLASRGPSVAGLDFLGREILTVTSGSMEPEFRTGDAIAVRRVDGTAAADLPTGTVVTFRTSGGNGTLITHRIVGSRISAGGQRVYTTKGDANADADTADLVPARIVGVLDYSVPRLGYVLNAMRQRSVTLPLAVSALLSSLAVSVWPRRPPTHVITGEHQIPNKKENT